ncbi:MAG: YceI family protein [Pseudomonadota bacterium]
MKKLFAATVLATASFAATAADTYVIDDTHTLPTFEVSHLGFSTTRGSFTETKGTVTLDTAKKTGSVDITIAVDSLQTAVPKLTDHLKSDEFFDAAKYPTITFKADQLSFEGERLKSVAGELTMHGVTKPVTLDVTHFVCKEHPMKKVPHCGADAVTTIKRSDWGIDAYLPAVGDEVTLKIQVEASKK